MLYSSPAILRVVRPLAVCAAPLSSGLAADTPGALGSGNHRATLPVQAFRPAADTPVSPRQGGAESGAADDPAPESVPMIDPQAEDLRDARGPLPGTVSTQFIRCGKANCRCKAGLPHGHYYRIWRGDAGKVHKVYVKPSEVAGVRACCDEYRVFDEHLRAGRARRKALTARLWVQIHRARRLRQA